MPPRVADAYSYSHLLGLYLGGGRVTPDLQLRVTCDALHAAIVDDVATSMTLVALGRTVRRTERRTPAATLVECQWPRWPDYIPQADADRTPGRPIALAPWQQKIVDREPEAFLRGLIESDGCRVINRFKTKLPSGRVAEYAYPRYFFSNASADIRGLFCAACERVGVRWTQSNARNISVAHRDSVALFDTFIGPKA